MGYLALLFLISILAVRGVEFFIFIKKVVKICHDYDWKYVNDGNDLLLLDILDNEHYYISKTWSAYNFLYLKGPSPLKMFFSFKQLLITNQYNKEVLNKIRKYEVV